MHTAGNKTRKMRHIHHQIGPDTVSYLAECGKVQDTRIGRPACDNHLWLVLLGKGLHFVHINPVILRADTILNGVKPFARLIRCRTVSEVTTRRQAHPQNRVSGLDEPHQRTLVRLRS